MTELLRNFWIRQSLPCMAEQTLGKTEHDEGKPLTCVRYFCYFVAIETSPAPCEYQRSSLKPKVSYAITYQKRPALTSMNYTP